MDTRPGRDRAPFRTILALAVPSSLAFGLMAAETAFINTLLASLEHATEAIAAYSIYFRVVMFALTPIIATGVAMLPYAARLFGEGDLAGIRRGLRDAELASVLYSLAVVGPVTLAGGPWLAEWLTESGITRDYTVFALRLVPMICLAGAPFLLCRPVFEGMNRGTPGLVIAVLRYVVLTLPLAWLGVQVSRSLGRPDLFGLLIGVLVAAVVASAVFALWLQAALRPQRAQAARSTVRR